MHSHIYNRTTVLRIPCSNSAGTWFAAKCQGIGRGVPQLPLGGTGSAGRHRIPAVIDCGVPCGMVWCGGGWSGVKRSSTPGKGGLRCRGVLGAQRRRVTTVVDSGKQGGGGGRPGNRQRETTPGVCRQRCARGQVGGKDKRPVDGGARARGGRNDHGQRHTPPVERRRTWRTGVVGRNASRVALPVQRGVWCGGQAGGRTRAVAH